MNAPAGLASDAVDGSPSAPASSPEPLFTPPPQRWVLAPADLRAADLASTLRIPQVIAQLLLARGIDSLDAAEAYLNPNIHQLHDPFLMRGMAEAVARIESAIANRETILLYGDYDVDGTTAVVLLKTAIEMAGGPSGATSGSSGAAVRFHVPHRLREGYGMQSAVLEEAAQNGVHLVITVDTGMRAFAEAATARRLGLDLIITDHHLPEAGESIPDCLAILNPNQSGCTYPEKSLCGAAIAFKVAQAVLERKGARDSASTGSTRIHDKIIPSFLKMVAIATVADAVPLKGENRVLAFIGIQELHRPSSTGLRALFAAAGLDPATKPLTSFDLGFRLGPRINAAGRMDIAAEVVELFTTRDHTRAHELALKLERLNTERREEEARILRDIEHRLATDEDCATRRMLVLAGQGWHRGIIGILASRVVERTAKPAIVVSIEDGVAYGSGRSIDGFPLLDSLESCAELFTRFGGHAFAVGFALPAERIPELQQRLYQFAAHKLAGQPVQHILKLHAELPIERVTPALGAWLRKLEPLGHGNPEPVFLARNLQLHAPLRFLKEKHIRLELLPTQDKTQSSALTTSPISVIGWNLAQRGRDLALDTGTRINLAYRIRENQHPQYGGLQIEIADLQPADTLPY
ncbi:single-stranded-DNA-specific exonuclease RecJ [Acidicapsa dinghuensis]|uniref:Single-stranded-DNA-specific exonuclease RecJ n=1 Tax=Acidicapsa dinghuensis TaxID=2218256 RepID=A0ABW1EIM3_9BACT|nr:single-stranded-DNA-specific exonuclease RecJ [Acidicapsa dinghuensis]